jgi:hypothetical protein
MGKEKSIFFSQIVPYKLLKISISGGMKMGKLPPIRPEQGGITGNGRKSPNIKRGLFALRCLVGTCTKFCTLQMVIPKPQASPLHNSRRHGTQKSIQRRGYFKGKRRSKTDLISRKTLLSPSPEPGKGKKLELPLFIPEPLVMQILSHVMGKHAVNCCLQKRE